MFFAVTSRRRAWLVPGGVALVVIALVVIALAVALLASCGGDDPPAGSGPTSSGADRPPTAPTTPEVPPALAAIPPWGDFPGAPPPLVPPPGGSVTVADQAGGTEIVILRADGSRLASVAVAPSGDPTDARYFDAMGRLRVVITATLPQPGLRRLGGASPAGGIRVRCGSAARSNAGWRLRIGPPARWRVRLATMPPGLRRAGGLRALRLARSTWNRNRSHCRGILDRSRVMFVYAGATSRPVGRNGVNGVDFGDPAAIGGVCPGTVACTVTWLGRGNLVRESDIRFNRRIRGGFSIRGRRGAFDLQSVMTHETGHTLGLGHVTRPDNVMYAFARRGSTTARRLGRGDAVINNRKY